MSHQKQKAHQDLQLILEDGYRLLDKMGVYATPKIDNWDEYVRQGFGQNWYENWVDSIKKKFIEHHLNFPRFKTRTMSSNKKADSPAVRFKNQILELDSLVNDKVQFDAYKLAPTHPEVEFKDGTIIQGYNHHQFRYDIYRDLLFILWDNRRIVNPNNQVLQAETPFPRSKIYNQLKINHDRFKDIVKSIKIEMRRKNIDLDIKFPNDVFIVVVQDFR
jgi:hypothetical protein